MMHLKFVYSQSLFTRFRHVILYFFIGLLASVLDFAIYTMLVYVTGIHYLIASSISVLAGILTSFILNRNWNFKVKEKTIQRFIIFLSVGLSGMMIGNLVLYVCVDQLHINMIVSKLLSIVLAASFQFLLNKYVTFKPAKK